MATVLPATKYRRNELAEALGEGISTVGTSAIKSYYDRSDEQSIQKSIESLGENPTARQVLDAITNTKTHTKEAKKQALSNYLGVSQFEELKRKAKTQEEISAARNEIAKRKEEREIESENKRELRAENKETREVNKDLREQKKLEQEKASTKAIVDQLDLPEEKKEQLRESLSLSSAEFLLKEQLKHTQDKLSPFQKKVQEKNAEEYVSLVNEIPKIESTLGDIAYARQLSDDLGILGTAAGALGLSKKAKELEGVSFTLMQPIVKIFNPSGPIAQQKLKMIQDKYVVSPSDAPWTRKAKLDALERFSKQALTRAQEKLALIKKYDGNPPEEVIKNFDKESNTLSDAMIDYDLVGEEAHDEGLPNPDKFKGKTITSPAGEKYHSDGTRWVKK